MSAGRAPATPRRPCAVDADCTVLACGVTDPGRLHGRGRRRPQRELLLRVGQRRLRGRGGGVLSSRGGRGGAEPRPPRQLLGGDLAEHRPRRGRRGPRPRHLEPAAWRIGQQPEVKKGRVSASARTSSAKERQRLDVERELEPDAAVDGLAARAAEVTAELAHLRRTGRAPASERASRPGRTAGMSTSSSRARP